MRGEAELNNNNNMENLKDLKKKLEKVEKELEKVRGKEYEQPFGSMRRAKISRKWDELAQDQFKLKSEIEKLENCKREKHNDDIFNHGECLECGSNYENYV